MKEPAISKETVVWLFGRGLSIECGLTWTEPEDWKTLFLRSERIERIKPSLRAEMDSPLVNTAPIRDFLIFLNQHTPLEWRHLFVTTNWDCLLQRELSAVVSGSYLPHWLRHSAGSHVHHLNGTVE